MSSPYPTKDKIACHQPKVKSLCFEDPYKHINSMYNTPDNTQLIDANEKYNR